MGVIIIIIIIACKCRLNRVKELFPVCRTDCHLYMEQINL